MRNFVVYYHEELNLMFHHWEYVGNDFEADMAKCDNDPISKRAAPSPSNFFAGNNCCSSLKHACVLLVLNAALRVCTMLQSCSGGPTANRAVRTHNHFPLRVARSVGGRRI